MGFPYMSFPESTSLAETAFARITATEGAELSRGGGHRRSCRVPAHAGGCAGLPVPLPRVGPPRFSPIPPGHHAPTPLPVELPSRVVPKGTALAHEAPSVGGHGKVWEQGSGSSRPPCTQQRGRSVRPCPLLHHAARELCPGPAPGVPGDRGAMLGCQLPARCRLPAAEPPRHAGTETASAPCRFLPSLPAARTRPAARGC